MGKTLNAVITGIGGYLPEDLLTNEDLSKMVDTTDEWIMSHIGVRTRHILKMEGVGSSYMGKRAIDQLLEKTSTDPAEIDMLILTSTTPDYHFPSTASMLCKQNGLVNAFAFDMQAACSGFIYGLEVGANFVRSGRCKKVIVCCAEKLSAITDYTDRATCPIFGDGAAAVLLEPTEEEIGVVDSYLRTDGEGLEHLVMKAGGSACPPSHETVDNRHHYTYQEGRNVYRHAVTDMVLSCSKILERNNLNPDEIKYVVPHQANMRIIQAVADKLHLPMEQVATNIEKVGNTSSASIPLCLLEYEKQLKKGDKIVLTAFGAGYTWGALYLKWGYDGDKVS